MSSVNGAAEIHSEIVKIEVFNEFYKVREFACYSHPPITFS
jgi:glucan phosphorylase